MAKKVKKTDARQAPDHLTMDLFAPGMSALHRAGLGGLACTLKAIERQHAGGLLRADKLPSPLEEGRFPWEIDDRNITLRFSKPENVAKYLEKLFAFAFQIRDGLIYLPGQYYTEPTTALLAELQLGLTLTFLQHGKVKTLAKEPTVVSYEPDSDGNPGVGVEYRKCSWFKHQNAWKECVDKSGCLSRTSIKVDGPISPGTVVRHVAYTGATAAEDPVERMIPLLFSMIGCLCLSVNRGVAALLIPEVEHLREFVLDRPAMTPTTASECQIANAADGAFQAQGRLRRSITLGASVETKGLQLNRLHGIPGCSAITFTPTPWASQQKSRVATIAIPTAEDRVLDRYERALAQLPVKIVTRTVRESSGRGKQKITTERLETFRSESIVRPLIAENLALDQPWYANFRDLMVKINPATNEPFRKRLPFERKGLHNMITDETMWDSSGESAVVQAVHAALRGRYGQIAEENKSKPVAMKNRFLGEYDKWRLAFSGAKTADQFRKALCDLFSRAGRNSVLQEKWQELLPMLQTSNWQQTRDLSLLALASYAGKGLPEE